MKKTFALVLAASMVMSMAAVSFAAPVTAKTGTIKTGYTLTSALKYSGDNNRMDKIGTGKVLNYGSAAYFQIQVDGVAIEDYKDVEKLKVKAKWEMGGDLVQSIAIVKKNIKPLSGTNAAEVKLGNGNSEYNYFVEVKTKMVETTNDADIIGTLTFNKKDTDDSNWELDDYEIDVTINLCYDGGNFLDSAADYKVTGDSVGELAPGDWYLLKFDYDDEVEFEFGDKSEQNEGTFNVDVSGQGKILFKFETTADEAIVAANPTAKLKFISFNNVKFNRTGEFMYEMENGKYAYQIVDGKLKAIGEYDDADEAFYFNTRVLGSYVFSDVELVDAAPAVTAPTETKPVTNPGTGAAL